jgi:hypothetical protein
MKEKPMSLLTVSASTADAVYHASLIILLAGTGLVFLSALALLWSGSVRDRDRMQRLAILETTGAQANAGFLKAKAEVAEANRQTAQAHAIAAAAENEVSQAKLANDQSPESTSGRQITAENCGLFINYVTNVAKGRVVLEAISSNREATHFAGQISAMLKSAGYEVQENYGSPTLLGLAPVGVQMKIRSMEDQPVYAGSLQKGLEFIGIDTSGSLDSTAGDSVMIFVGTKP